MNIGKIMLSKLSTYKKILVIIFALAAIAKVIIIWYNTKPVINPISTLDHCLDLHKSCVKKVESIESCGHFRDYYLSLCENFLVICKSGCENK